MLKFEITKKEVQKKNLGILFLAAFLSLSSIFFIFSLASCTVVQAIGLGNVVSEERPVSGIDSISIGSSMNLIIEQAENESLRIEASENILPNVTAEVVGGELQIGLKPISFSGIMPINCYVSVKDLEAIKVSSSATVKCEDLKAENLLVEMASSSKGSLKIDVTNLEIKIASSASLALSGEAISQNIKVNSSGKLDAFSLNSKDCKIEVASSGSADISVSENLDAKVSSSASVNYKGNPTVNSDISSSGSLRKVSD